MIKIVELSSGIRLVMEYLPYVQSVAAGIWVKAGSVNEDPKYQGISHFTEHMMFKGTGRRTAKDISYDVERIGGVLNAFTGKEATCYYVRTTHDNFEQAAEVLIDMLTDSLFAKEEMDRERMVVIEEIKMTEDTPDELSMDLAGDMVFRGRSIGNSVIGTKSAISRVTTPVMRDYVDREYTRDSMVISVSGNFDEERMVAYFDDKFMSLRASKPAFERREGRHRPGFRSVVKDIEQTHISLATESISLDDERYYALAVLTNAMGGSMSSRLFQNIRERKGLSYAVYATNACYSDAGYFEIYTAVAHDKVLKALEGIREELVALQEKGLTYEELESAREQLKASYIFGEESISGRMFKNGKNLLLLNRIYTAKEITDGFDRVCMDDINGVIPMVCDLRNYSAAAVSDHHIDMRRVMGRLL